MAPDPVLTTFEASYTRARDIARYPPNWIRTCDGEDLLGKPHLDLLGQPLLGPDGRVIWESKPRSGCIPNPDGTWSPVPFLAVELRSKQEDANGTVALRVTPEVRVERVGGLAVPVRTLSIEATILVPSKLKPAGIKEIAQGFGPILKPWYPLHASVVSEWLTGEPVVIGPFRSQAILYRFRASHLDPNTELTLPGEAWSIWDR